MPKKILVITTMYPSKSNKTFGIFVKNQVEELRKHSSTVDVSAILDDKTSKLHVILKYFKWIMYTLFLLLTKGRKYDLVHAHYAFPSGWLGLLFKKLLGVKLVVTCHGGDIDKMAKINKFTHNQTKKILNGADHVIAVGEGLKEDIINDFSVSESSITVMSMGINRQVFKPTPKNEARRSLDMTDSSKHILFVGNIISAKGIEELIEAFKLLKQEDDRLSLQLVGQPKQEAFLNKLKQKIHDEHIEGVTFHGALSQKEVAVWMAAADVFVLPSYIEGFGLVAVEAMSCHTPVVATKVGGLQYLLDESLGVLVPPRDSAALKGAIKNVMEDEHLRYKLIKHGENKAQENDHDVLIDRLRSIYDEIGAK
ncbi:glycosyltransferase [Halobacillus sp. A1]|uniref:glycosyltransferase n=1 Tax=Halobacillus sp. A1 TaxID=2880262 RepID=UPI0020A679DD|nr:glycosyltransferase [Halobacillus sp. A1]MCP3031464.1 glycosyltransferase [Halobacillus sp. A1]